MLMVRSTLPILDLQQRQDQLLGLLQKMTLKSTISTKHFTTSLALTIYRISPLPLPDPVPCGIHRNPRTNPCLPSTHNTIRNLPPVPCYPLQLVHISPHPRQNWHHSRMCLLQFRLSRLPP